MLLMMLVTSWLTMSGNIDRKKKKYCKKIHFKFNECFKLNIHENLRINCIVRVFQFFFI